MLPDHYEYAFKAFDNFDFYKSNLFIFLMHYMLFPSFFSVEDSPISSLVVYIGSGSGALIGVIVIVIVIMAVLKCRRKPKPEPDPEM